MAAAFAVVFLIVGCGKPPTTVLVVRHAEKAEGNNPSLTNEGWARASALAGVAGQADITAIYATEFCRTVQTAVPMAQHLNLPIYVQEVRGGEPGLNGCVPPVDVPVEFIRTKKDYFTELADRIRSKHAGSAVLVVGHSNTVSQLIQALGAPLMPDIPEDQFDNLYIVVVSKRGVRLIKGRYGAPR
jgi:broad specificity phosphatase PhoE